VTDLWRAIALVASGLTDGPETAEQCCVFARLVLEAAGMDVAKASIPLWHLHASEGDPWGPVTAAVRCGAVDAPSLATPGWYLCQGWRGTPMGPGVSGHTFFVRVVGGRLAYVVDSAAGRTGRGDRVELVELGAPGASGYLRQYRGGVRAARVG